ncbi:unnamed protein product [Symbiodinium sp. CCMP2592]|nr:unnamed protein product [Symbiodinium sp. CCMP2592]
MDALGALDSLSEDESFEEIAEPVLEKPLDFQALQPHLGKESAEDAEGLDRIYIKFKEQLSTTAAADGEVQTSNEPPESRDPSNDEFPVLQLSNTRRPMPASLVDGAYEKSQPQKILDYDIEQSEGDLRLQSLLQGSDELFQKQASKRPSCRCSAGRTFAKLLLPASSVTGVVLLNLVRLRELQIEYCPLLRKSEDLALSYEVILATGHLLKCQCYAYRAIHLERGGAEEVRRECRGGSSTEPSRLLLGGRSALQALPTRRQRTAVEALLTWMARSRTGAVDHHGDFNDGAEEASEALLDT